MKKIIKMGLLLGALIGSMCISAAAAAVASSGMYGVTGNLTPLKEDGTKATTVQTVVGDSTVDLYEDAVKVEVTLTDAVQGQYYLILALDKEGASPSEDNIKYIDQKTGEDGSVVFTVYPSELVGGETYTIYVYSNDGITREAAVGSFTYYVPYKMGDVNMDGKFTAQDALDALQMAVGKGTWTDTQRIIADVNGTTGLTAEDALFILQRAVGKRDDNFELIK